MKKKDSTVKLGKLMDSVDACEILIKNGGVLSDKDIKLAIKCGLLKIKPLNLSKLQPSSIDVR